MESCVENHPLLVQDPSPFLLDLRCHCHPLLVADSAVGVVLGIPVGAMGHTSEHSNIPILLFVGDLFDIKEGWLSEGTGENMDGAPYLYAGVGTVIVQKEGKVHAHIFCAGSSDLFHVVGGVVEDECCAGKHRERAASVAVVWWV